MLFGNATIAQLLASVIALLIAFTVHEATHALMATNLGDTTARRLGRLSLNPVAHLDPLGTIMILVSGFGWGKPVPVNPYNLRPAGRLGMGLVAAAGPISNILLAYVFAAPFRANLITIGMMRGGDIIPSLGQVLFTVVMLNVYLAVFNLLPVAPLDGFKVVLGLLPPRWAYALARTERYGPLILLFLILSGGLIRFNLLDATLVPVARVILQLVLG
ncbi:MAG: site-2 protease family protein [Anaerolineae bacterium]|jgi:Zn-dependent protease